MGVISQGGDQATANQPPGILQRSPCCCRSAGSYVTATLTAICWLQPMRMGFCKRIEKTAGVADSPMEKSPILKNSQKPLKYIIGLRFTACTQRPKRWRKGLPESGKKQRRRRNHYGPIAQMVGHIRLSCRVITDWLCGRIRRPDPSKRPLDPDYILYMNQDVAKREMMIARAHLPKVATIAPGIPALRRRS